MESQSTSMTPPPFVSASLISGFERCPWQTIRSQRRQFEQQPKVEDYVSDNAAMQYGTDFHGVMETLQEFADDPDGLLRRLEVLFGEEAGEVLDSIQEIRERDQMLGRRSVGTEVKFELWEPELGVTITGHIDELLVSTEADGKTTLTIRDFKTGRLYESAVAWTNRIQPRVYNYAVRHPAFREQYDLPEFDSYSFEICYPRQNATASWKLDPETPALLEYVGRVWHSMCDMYGRGFAEGDPAKYYPQILNEYCRNCHVRRDCAKHQAVAHMEGLQEELQGDQDESLVEAFLRLQNVAKVVEGELDRRKSEVRAMFAEGVKRLDLQGHTFSLQSRTDVTYAAAEVLQGMLRSSTVDLDMVDFNKLFDVSNVEVRKLLKQFPSLGDIFEAAKSSREGSTYLRYAGAKDRHGL